MPVGGRCRQHNAGTMAGARELCIAGLVCSHSSLDDVNALANSYDARWRRSVLYSIRIISVIEQWHLPAYAVLRAALYYERLNYFAMLLFCQPQYQ